MLECYFTKMNKIIITVVKDQTGGYNTKYSVGDEFQGLAVRTFENAKQVGSDDAIVDESYKLSFEKSANLKKDDIVAFKRNGENVYILITAEPQDNPFADWRLTSATRWLPTEDTRCSL